MKKIIVLIFLGGNFLTTYSQNCSVPVAETLFLNKVYSPITSVAGDASRLDVAEAMCLGKCFSTDQVRRLALLLNSDESKFTLITNVYPNIVDRSNGYSLLDAFSKLSNAFAFYDFMNSYMEQTPPPPPPPLPVFSFPNLVYPSAESYKGIIGCNLPLSDNDFLNVVQPLVALKGDAAIQPVAMTMAQSHCLSISQAMKLSTLLSLELNRLNFLKAVFEHLYDLGNYGYASVVFSSSPYQTDWNNFAKAKVDALTTPPPPPPPPPCVVSESELGPMKTQITNAMSSSTKLTLAKSILQAKKCFSTSQIKQLVALMTFDSDQLALAKFAYDYCTDKPNYYQVADVLQFSSSQQELLNYIKGH